MRNTNIAGADRATHLKVVGVSLAASIVVLAVTIALRTVPADAGLQTAHGPVIKATKTIVTTTNDTNVIR
ncbi:MAG TPA: hypothetical protein VM867_10695 [Xanthobacteraceae bacterium]|jgi:hypothetical protein|nr:hypothetical protein [Xanthobacteraceae bacterium]